jgi:hypothetical protein
MAQAKTDPTRIDDHDDLPLRPAWLRLKDVWQQWRDRLGLSLEAAEKLEALLRNRETRSAKQQVNASGEVTRDILHAEFWRDEARLEVDTDVDGADHLRVDYPVYVHFDGPAEFLVRAVDVERWEGLYPTIAAPPPPRPPAAQTAPDEQPDKAADPFKATGRPPARALPASDPPKHMSTQEWVTAEAIQLKKDNKISANERRHISHFAKLLAKRMEKAAETNKSIRSRKWGHIKNMLPKWKLWPVESIKIS